MKFALHAVPLCLLVSLPCFVTGCGEGLDARDSKSPPATEGTRALFGPDTSPIPPDLSKGWCGGHGVPESVCTRCDDSLIERFKAAGDWCAEHGLPETQCIKCNPEVKERWEKLKPDRVATGANQPAQTTETITVLLSTSSSGSANPCEAHGIPRDVCTRCNPTLIDAFKKAGDWCGEHGVPESQCPLCNSGLRDRIAAQMRAKFATLPLSQRPPSPSCRNHESIIRLANAQLAAKAGFTFEPIRQQPMDESVVCNVELAYDGNRFAKVSSRVPGVVREVLVDLGKKVQAGETLVVIDSPELATAKADLIQAVQSLAMKTRALQRQNELKSTGLASLGDVQEAENNLMEATIVESRAVQKLQLFGLLGDEITRVKSENDTTSTLPLVAPVSGEIVERDAVLGEGVDSARSLFTIADTTHLWAMLDVADPRVQLRIGMPVALQFPGLDGAEHHGEINWISPKLDERTRTLKARAQVDNTDGALKANMFGQATVRVRVQENVLVAPHAAVQWDGCCNVVFVKENESTFQTRKVRLGIKKDNIFEIREGVREGEVVVVDGSFLLKTELLKSEIGAGCCPTDTKRN